MLDSSVSFNWKSDLIPHTGDESRTSERKHMGMFWQSCCLVPGDKTKRPVLEGSVYCAALVSSTGCPRHIYLEQNHKFSELSPCYAFMEKHQKTACCISGSDWDMYRCYEKEPDVEKTLHLIRWPIMWKEILGFEEVRLSESEMQKMVWDNEECDRGACGAESDMCKNMWKTFTSLKAVIFECREFRRDRGSHYHFSGW